MYKKAWSGNIGIKDRGSGSADTLYEDLEPNVC